MLRGRLIDRLNSTLPCASSRASATPFREFCFNRVRTALWRAVDVEIGVDSLLMGDLILSGAETGPRC